MRMRKTKKGFTLIEVVVTLAILGVSFALTGIVVSQLTGVQNATSVLVSHETVFDNADRLISEYVSYVSVVTPSLSFQIAGSSSSVVSFEGRSYPDPDDRDVYASAAFSLTFDSTAKNLTVTSSSSETLEGYLAKSDWSVVKGMETVEFTYDASISLLTAVITINENLSRTFAYVVRA